MKAIEITATGADLKTVGSSLHDPTEAEMKFIQAGIDETNRKFSEHVTAGRPDIDQEVFRAGYYSGEQAQELGLVDFITPREELMTELAALN